MQKSTTIAVDMANSVFELVISDRLGRVAVGQRLSRGALAASARLRHKKATVALANKLARYALAVATRELSFDVTGQAA